MQLDPDSEKQELWEEIQRLRRAVEEAEMAQEKARKAAERAQRELDDYKKRHPETVGVKNGKAYEFRSPAEPLSKSGKKPGAQPGHIGHRRPVAEYLDAIVDVAVVCCPDCGGDTLSDVQEKRTRTVEDIPPCKPTVKKYVIERRYCRACKKLVEAPVPGVLPRATIGLRAMLIVAWLRFAHRMPEEVVPQVLNGLFNLRISSGEVQHILQQLANEYGDLYDEMKQDLRKRSAKNIDETSWRTNGVNHYAWAFVTKWETIFEIGVGRKHDVPLAMLGTKAAGTMVVDGFSAYPTLASKTNLKLQRCWAHILGDAAEHAQFYGQEATQTQQGLQAIYAKAKTFNGHGTEQNVAKLKDELLALLQRPFKSHHCATFARNLVRNADDLFRFVTDPAIDGTNNRAERAIRLLAVARKISGDSRTPNGARIRSVLPSIQQTMAQRGLAFLEGPRLQAAPASDG